MEIKPKIDISKISETKKTGVPTIKQKVKIENRNSLRSALKTSDTKQAGITKKQETDSSINKNEVKPPRHITTINEELAGKKHPDANVEYRKHVFILNGEKVEGVFPVFESKVDIRLPKDMYTASDTEQFKYCIQQLAKHIENNPELAKQFTPRQLEQIKNGEPRISGLTWHHNEIPGRMQLVDANKHRIGHTGGRSIWGGGSDYR